MDNNKTQEKEGEILRLIIESSKIKETEKKNESILTIKNSYNLSIHATVAQINSLDNDVCIKHFVF